MDKKDFEEKHTTKSLYLVTIDDPFLDLKLIEYILFKKKKKI